jgi:hypothetical protein
MSSSSPAPPGKPAKGLIRRIFRRGPRMHHKSELDEDLSSHTETHDGRMDTTGDDSKVCTIFLFLISLFFSVAKSKCCETNALSGC